MADLNQGTQRLSQVNSVLKALTEVYKYTKEMYADSKALKQFSESLQQTDPKHPVMDETNMTVYSTKGMDIEKTRDLLKRCNIPSVMVTNKQGELFVAVPKQFGKQANLILGVKDQLEQTDPADFTPQEKTLLKRLTSGEKIPSSELAQLPAPIVTQSLLSGKLNAYEGQPKSLYPQVLGGEMKQESIPFAMVDKPATETQMIMFHSRYTPQVDSIDATLQRQPTEVSPDAFVKNNLGKEVVHKSGLTAAQVQDFREAMAGSVAGFYIEKPSGSEQTYTIHYPADKAHLVAPKIFESYIRTNGLNHEQIEAFAQQKHHDAFQIATKAANGESLIFGDAANKDNYFTTDKTGLRDSNGQLVVSNTDDHFKGKVFSAAMRMKAPITKANPAGKNMDGMFTVEEIMKAQETAAKSSPTQADIAAAKIATFAVQPDVTAPNHSLAEINKSTSNNLKGIANALESTRHELNPKELAEVLQLKPEEVEDFCGKMNALPPEERAMYAEAFRATAMQYDTATPEVAVVGIQDLPLPEMEAAMEKDTTDRVIAEEVRHAETKHDMLHGDNDPDRSSFDGEFVDDNHDGIADGQQGHADNQRGDDEDGGLGFGDDTDFDFGDIGIGE